MSEFSKYKPRKSEAIPVSLNESIDFLALDWYECDLNMEAQIEKKECYLNQDHSKIYTIFIFGVNSKGESVCVRVKNYLPYFYLQIPDEFNERQIQDFVSSFDSNNCEDYNEEEIAEYEEAIASKNYKFTEAFKSGSRYYKDSIVQPYMNMKTKKYEVFPEVKSNLKTQLVEKKIFWTFMNEQKFKFIKVAHKSKQGHRFMERFFKNPVKLKINGKSNTPIKYNLYESDLEPVLRFLHDTKVKPSSWIHIPPGKFKIENRQSKAQINISCDWTEICPLERNDIPPLLIASFDIEADSSHGDFPIPKKDCKKLSNQLIVSWIKNVKIVEKKEYDSLYKRSKNTANNKLNLPDELIFIEINNKSNSNNSNNSNNTYNSISELEYITNAQEYIDAKALQSSQTSQSSNSNKEISYLREVIKYIKAKQCIAEKQDFFSNRIKQALGYGQFANLDNEIDLIYLKKPMKAKVFVNSNAFTAFVEKIYAICNHPIRKVKANNEMKKAVKEVVAIEAAKTKTNPRFGIEDLKRIIIDIAKKHDILIRDLQDKIITKEVIVRFINHEINKIFGFAEGDKVIQIGTVFWRYGESNICHNNIITLRGCDKFNVGDKECEVISKSMERDVLLEWTKLIELHDPDIIIGYNTFGFDESFMYDRIADLCIDVERVNLSKEDMKTLESNTQYQKFINLGRLDDSIVKKVSDAKGGIINKKLSSSALGDNFLYYFNMPGRVQIDLLKVCQASLTKLPSYKLDSVAEFYISGKIKEIICGGEYSDSNEESAYLKVDNINELEIGNYIVISMAATTAKLFDGEKMKILE